MLLKSFIVVLTVCVYGILAVTPFADKGQRAEIFELTDNELPIIRITLPDEEYALMKIKANIGGIEKQRMNLTDIFDYFIDQIRFTLEFYQGKNFFELSTTHNFTEILPEFNIDDQGFPHMDIEGIINGYDTDVKHYVDVKYGDFEIAFVNSNSQFDIYRVINVVNEIAREKMLHEAEEEINEETVKSLTKEAVLSKVKSMVSKEDHNIDENLEVNVFKKIDDEDNADNNSIIAVFNNTALAERSKMEDITQVLDLDEEETFGYYEDETEGLGDDDIGGYIEYDNMDFKTKNATMTVELSGNKKNFGKVTLSLSGNSSRYLAKLNYNVKIHGDENLYGRSQFKLRADFYEPTYLRSKLTSDIHDRLGLTAISANYALLYINDEYYGLYILTDAIKQSWIEYVYGERNTTSLYKCDGSFLDNNSRYGCHNEIDDWEDYTELNNFIDALENAKSISDVESFLDVDQFLTEMVIEYLIGGWDHIQRIPHNYFMYKQTNGKWRYHSYDYDNEFGNNIDRVFLEYILDDLPERMEILDLDYPNYSFSEWANHSHILEILILNDSSRFDVILKDVVKKVFNPATLFPHIDELKEYIRPYVELDKIADANGKYPGRINEKVDYVYSLAEWDANSEFTTVETIQYSAYGIKYWILSKYRYVCNAYNIECDPVYMDENYSYPIDNEVEFKGYYDENNLTSKEEKEDEVDDTKVIPLPEDIKNDEEEETQTVITITKTVKVVVTPTIEN